MADPASGIKVENLGLTVKAMKELGAVRSELVKPGYEAAVKLIKAAEPLVPFRTGALQASMRPRKIERGASAMAGGAKAPYAGPIHWGWLVVGATHKGTLKVGTYRGIKPQPFFAEALGYAYEDIVNTYDLAMKKLINELPGASKK